MNDVEFLQNAAQEADRDGLPVTAYRLLEIAAEVERLRKGEQNVVYYACKAGVYEGKLNQVTLDGDEDWVVPLPWCHATRAEAEAAEAAGGE